MKIAKYVLVGCALLLLGGCVYPDYGYGSGYGNGGYGYGSGYDNGGGWGFDYSQGDYRAQGGGQYRGAEQDRSDVRDR
jgi:hypothetical protein